MQVKLSAVIITFNEERNIARCIDSLQEVADEILVVDSFSTDKTEQICLERNVRFIKNKFEGHVEQKNFALKEATHQHVLSLDADEALNEELKKSILNIKSNWVHDGYIMNRLTNYCGKWIKHCGWYPDRKLRLCNRDKAEWRGTNPHDRLELLNNSKVVFIQGDLLHYSFYTVDEHRRQINYFTDVSSKALFKNGRKANFLNIIFNPIAQFLKGYFIKLGFLDGKYGFVICRLSAYAKYLKYSKLLKLQQAN